MTTALLVIAILILLIVVHELGHFIAAKIFRVRVEEFGIGYPPRAFTLGKIGTTEYTLNWIPFGGFVRLFGDVGEGQHGRGSLVDANRGAQAVILVAGVAMNVVMAWFLFAAAMHYGIPRAVESIPEGAKVRLLVANVVAGSPAEAAGIARGDEIVALEDMRGRPLWELTPEAISEFTSEHGGEALVITYLHGGATSTATVVPAHAVIPNSAGRPALGIAPVLVTSEPLPWGKALIGAFGATKNAFGVVGSGLWGIVQKAFSGGAALSEVVGPIGLFGIVGQAAENGIAQVLSLAGFISINLAFINLIPVPALDGGRLALLGVEALMRRSAPRLALQLFNAIGIALVVFLMVLVTFNDIGRLLA